MPASTRVWPTDAEQEAFKAKKLFLKGTYFRFNPGTTNAKGDYDKAINLADWQGMEAVKKETETYLGSKEAVELVKTCAVKLGVGR